MKKENINKEKFIESDINSIKILRIGPKEKDKSLDDKSY